MSGLAQGQFIDYLIIGIGCAVIAGIVIELVKKGKISPGRTFSAVLIIVACVAARFYLQRPKPEVNITGPKFTFSPTPHPVPSVTSSRAIDTTPRRGIDGRLGNGYIAPPPRSLRKPGQWSVIIADSEGHEEYPKLADTVSSVLSEKGQSTAAIFRPAATRGTGFKALFAADPAVTRQLNQYCDKVLLGRVVSTERQNPISPGLLSLTLTLSGKIISTRTGDVQHEFELSAVGAGYSTKEAKMNAEDTLATDLRSELLKAIQ